LIRVGRYGPYVEVPVEGADKPMTASLPDETAPADVTREMIEELVERAKKGDEPIGEDPDSGRPVYVLTGRYGPYLQLGEKDDEAKPRRVSLPKGTDPLNVSLEYALAMLALPRELGNHPETGKVVKAGIGQYGPYVVHERTYASLKAPDDVLSVELDRAVELIAQKASRGRDAEPLRELGAHPEDGKPMVILDGRYGPYVKHGKTNASLPKGTAVEDVTVEQAVELLAKRKAAPKRPRRKS
jgi:DNA topoisomerase-1